jgi:hypothetical protein
MAGLGGMSNGFAREFAPAQNRLFHRQTTRPARFSAPGGNRPGGPREKNFISVVAPLPVSGKK